MHRKLILSNMNSITHSLQYSIGGAKCKFYHTFKNYYAKKLQYYGVKMLWCCSFFCNDNSPNLLTNNY